MAVVTSKKDSKMPVASDIRWYIPTDKKRYNNIVTNEYRRYRPKLCFKQPSSKNTKSVSWQIKYRFKYRYTPAAQKAAKKKSAWTDWSKWRTPYRTKYRGSNGKSVEYGTGAIVPDPMYWLKGNRSYAVNSTYNYFLNWYDNPKWMKADYDCITFEFAVRSYKNKKHGEWTTKKLSVYRRAEVRDEVLIRKGGGGLQIDQSEADACYVTAGGACIGAGGPACEGIGILCRCFLRRRCAGIFRRFTFLDLRALQHRTIRIFEDNDILCRFLYERVALAGRLFFGRRVCIRRRIRFRRILFLFRTT